LDLSRLMNDEPTPKPITYPLSWVRMIPRGDEHDYSKTEGFPYIYSHQNVPLWSPSISNCR
jgi:hypothetical protein